MDDFIKANEQEFTTSAGSWKAKPLTAGVENDHLNELLERRVNEEGIPYLVEKPGAYNRLRMRQITKVPYSKEKISEVLGLDELKDWIDLSDKQKDDFLGMLNHKLFSELVVEINKLNTYSEDDIKNLKTPSSKDQKQAEVLLSTR